GLHWLALAFVLFRFFDILKPWPISWLDKHMHGGFGIMIDDVAAGIFAWLCLHFIVFLL
ncbi:MAG: phosphatidylglycerophosphatase A, partial [Flavobacteriales bacterium]